MHARELLLQRQKELRDSIAAVDTELSQIARALKAMDEKPTEVGQFPPARDLAPPPPPVHLKHPMKVNDAIILAVEAGHKTPTQILAYLKAELGVETTLNSVRSRVSPLGQQGLIGHDGSGWIPANKDEALNGNAASASKAGGEGAPTPASPSLNL
jgi:hypothetical protein